MRFRATKSAIVWQLIAIFMCYGVSLNLWASPCDNLLRSGFENLSVLRTQNERQLTDLSSKYEILLGKLQSQLDQAKQKVAKMESDERADSPFRRAVEAMFRAESEIKNVKQYLQAIEREHDRRHGRLIPQSGGAVVHPDIRTVQVGGKTWPEVKAEIARVCKSLGLDLHRQVLRYFASAREDLVLGFGTDRHGADFDHEFAWDEYLQQEQLKARHLLPEDGFFAEEAEYYVDKPYATTPNEFEDDFMEGRNSIVIYDYDQLEDTESDFFIFRNRGQKGKAVVAIIRPIP